MVIIDTSSWVQALRQRGDDVVRKRVGDLLGSGEAAWCDMVRLELWNGAAGTQEKKRLQEIEDELLCLPIDDDVWNEACRIAVKARDRAVTATSADILILACARAHAASVEHCDKHFDALQAILSR